MITDKDRIDFIESNMGESRQATITLDSKHVTLREEIDRAMAQQGDWEFPDLYCTCGCGYTHWDIEYLDHVRSSPKQCYPSGSESWMSWYTCSECGEEIEVEEGN